MEYWDIYDKDRNFSGKKKGKYETWYEGEYHLAAEGWIINSKKEILVQQRSQMCAILPGVWALTTGRVIAGETTLQGCIREFKEELGIDVKTEELRLMDTYTKGDMIWDIYFVRKDVSLEDIVLQEEEVARVKFVDTLEFRQMLDEGIMYKYDEIYELLDFVDNQL